MSSIRIARVMLTVVLLVTLAPSLAGAVPAPAPGVSWPAGLMGSIRSHPQRYRVANGYRKEMDEIRANQRAMESGAPRSSLRGRVQVSGTRRLPVLAAKFADTGADPILLSDLQTELFGPFWPTGTMTDYFHEASYGALTVTGDVFDWTILPQIATFYEGEDDTCHGNPDCGGEVGEFVKTLIGLNDPWIDFGLYDNDGPDGMPNSIDDDGKVDALICVQPRQGGECGTRGIWSHQANLHELTGSSMETNDLSVATGDYIRVDDYVIVPALSCNGSMIEIGVFCHEFVHVFDIPDLYEHGGPSNGVGLWCLMGSGNYGGDGQTSSRPLHLSAWCKQKLGWVNPVVVEDLRTGAPIRSVESFPDVFKIFPFLQPGPEYFLIENREHIGFDSQLPGVGLAIWHVDEAIVDNDDAAHKLVDLEEADGFEALDWGGSDGDDGDLYPGSKLRRVFNDETSPDTKNYDFDETCIAVADISDPGETMMATLAPIDACPDHPKCQRVKHGIILTPAEGKDLSNVTLDEKWKDRVRARSRICKERNADPFWASSGWIEIPDDETETVHYAEIYAGNTASSYALAKSGIVITRSPDQIEAKAVVNTERVPTTEGCDRNPQKWRKRAAKAKTVGMVKVRASGSVHVSGLRWIGGFGNCKGSNRERLVKDPVDVEFNNLTTGAVTRERLVDIQSRVWDGETYWTFRITPPMAPGRLTPYNARAEDARGEGCGDDPVVPQPPRRSGFERILQNTARRMLFMIDVGGASVPADQHGRLLIACRNGTIQDLEATGIYDYVGSLLAVGQPSTFEIPLAAIRMDVTAPGLPDDMIETTFEGGGGQVQDGLPESMLLEGCELTTGIADGVNDLDTSAPQGTDQTLGFDAGTGVQWIAQEFVIPPGQLLMAGTVSLLAFQEGMPFDVPPSIQSVTSQIYDGPPWGAGSHLLFSSVTTGADLEAEWAEVDRTPRGTPDDGSRPIMELQLWCPECPEVPLSPGPKWLVLSIQGDPDYGPVGMPPCPYAGDTDNAWGYDVVGGTWHPLLDSGSGRPVSFPIDIYGGAREDTTATMLMDCVQPLFLADLGTHSMADGIRVHWNLKASATPESLGFNLLRASGGSDDFVRLNTAPFEGRRKYSFLDRDVVDHEIYRYQVEALQASGEHHVAGVVTSPFEPPVGDPGELLTLAPNVPNPFTESTRIRFALRQPSPLTIRIFDSAGRLCRNLTNMSECPPGEIQEVWDGRDDQGQLVSGGIYHVRIETPLQSKASRMLVLR